MHLIIKAPSSQQIKLFIMHQLADGFCPAGSPAKKLCIGTVCPQISIRCQNADCQCQQNHKNCIGATDIPSLLHKINTKGRAFFPLVHCYINWCLDRVKYFTTLADEAQKIIDEEKLTLLGSENTFYNLLNKKQYHQITSKLICQVSSSLQRQPTINTENRVYNFRQKLEEINLSMEQAVKRMKQFRDSTKFCQFRFSDQKIHRQIKFQNNSITCCEDGNYRMALLQPAIQPANDKEQLKVRFRIVSTKNKNIDFGVCQLKGGIIKKLQVQYGKDVFGEDKAVIHSIDGKTYSLIDKQRNNKQSKIKCICANEILEVSFNASQKKVQFFNQSRKQKDSLNLRYLDRSFSLYFCVLLSDKDDRVQLIVQ